jgi:hypothetical protein
MTEDTTSSRPDMTRDDQQPCPTCDGINGRQWISSSATTDTCFCGWCGAEWAIPVHTLGRPR